MKNRPRDIELRYLLGHLDRFVVSTTSPLKNKKALSEILQGGCDTEQIDVQRERTFTMVKSDDIEVYLKPAGKRGETLRFPEIELPPDDDDDGKYKRCFVPFSNGPVKVVIKFSDDYNMFSADVVHVGIGVANKEFVEEYVDISQQTPGDRWPWIVHLADGTSDKSYNADSLGLPEQLNRFKCIPAAHVPGQQTSFTSWNAQVIRMPRVHDEFTTLGTPQ